MRYPNITRQPGASRQRLGRRTTLAGTLGGLAALLLVTGCETTTTRAELSALPPAVQRAARGLAAGVPDSGIRVSQEPNGIVTVSFARGGIHYETRMDSVGTVLTQEESIRYRPAPAGSPVIAAAASACEDLAEAVLTGGGGSLDSAVAHLAAAVSQARGVLPGSAAALDSGLQAVQAAAAHGHARDAALAAVELYRTLVASPDSLGSPEPVEIALLDYSGFRLGLLAGARTPDWRALERTAAETHTWWASQASRVSSTAVRDLMTHLDEGLRSSIAARDKAATALAARLLLDTVDLLESDFMRSYQRGAGAVPDAGEEGD